jgi:hypothetical protein
MPGMPIDPHLDMSRWFTRIHRAAMQRRSTRRDLNGFT